MRIKAIPTKYKGCFFRSRAEARFAVFCDSLGINWEYEVQGYDLPSGKYLPDFWLPEKEFWIEIKGPRPSRKEVLSFIELCAATDRFGYLFYDQIGDPRFRVVRHDGEIQQVKKSSGWVGVQTVKIEKQVPATIETPLVWDGEAIESSGWSINPRVSAFAEIGGEIEIVQFQIAVLDQQISETVQRSIGAVNHSDAMKAVVNYNHDGSFGIGLFSGSPRDFSSQRLTAAYAAARSARFEHGETPP